jgi:hypothetical protein
MEMGRGLDRIGDVDRLRAKRALTIRGALSTAVAGFIIVHACYTTSHTIALLLAERMI